MGIFSQILSIFKTDQGFTKLRASAFKSAYRSQKTSVLIDVRTAKEFKSGHIKGAKNINVMGPTFINAVNKIDRKKPIFLYCRSGSRSAMAARRLVKMGFDQVYDLRGGYITWQ